MTNQDRALEEPQDRERTTLRQHLADWLAVLAVTAAAVMTMVALVLIGIVVWAVGLAAALD